MMNSCRTFIASSVILFPILAFQAFSQGSVPVNSGGGAAQARQLLDKGVCAFKDKNYALAQTDFEKALRIDPSNKFLPVFIARAVYFQYQPDIQTAGNLAKGREVIAAYKKVLAGDPGDAEAASAIAELYEQVDRPHLQDIAADVTVPKEVRKRIYVRLAGKSNTCANDITEANRTEVNGKGQWSYKYHMPRNKEDLQKGRTCAREGLDLIEKALELVPNDESAWSYKASLLIQSTRFAEMEQHADEKAAYGKQAEQAKSVFKKISDEAREKQRKADDDELLRNKGRKKTPEEEYPEFQKFAATGKWIREPEIDGSEVESPLYRLVAPTSNGDISANEKPINPKKLPWKTFSTDQGEFTALLPSPLDIDGSATFTVESEGVTYLISATKIPPAAPVSTDAMLVGAAFEITGAVCSFSLMAKSTCVVSLARKLTLNNYPGVQYNVEETRCENVFKGLIRVYATRERLYTIVVAGADENDPRVGKFLTSIVLR